jgi:heme a synthase
MNTSHFRKITLTAMILALIVIVLGAYVRLSDAGLGCPDWPGCYGQFSAPDNMEEITRAELLYPHQAVESEKAWKEMLHRYLASTLGLLIVGMAVIAWKNRKFIDQQLILPTLLVGLVIFQGMLGMWTVTLLLKPTIVTLHLLTGLLTLSLLSWCYLKSQNVFSYRAPINRQLRIWSRLALIVLSIQIFLGGWTSTHYVFQLVRGNGCQKWTLITASFFFGKVALIMRVACYLPQRVRLFMLCIESVRC